MYLLDTNICIALLNGNPKAVPIFNRYLLKVIVHKPVPDRPARTEPRAKKRRPKAYPSMTKPCHELRKQLKTA